MLAAPGQTILKDQATASLRRVYFDAEDGAALGVALSSADMDIGATGSFTVKISKNGGASSTPTGSTVTQIDATNLKGAFYVELAAGDVDTGGILVFYVSSAGGPKNMVPRMIFVRIGTLNDQDAVRAGLTALPNAAAEAAGGLFTRGTGAGQINQPANGIIDVAPQAHDPVASAEWAKNEATAAKRRLDIGILTDGGIPADRGTDFTGKTWIAGVGSPDFVAAAGTLTNKRRALVVADDDFTATHGTETLTAVAHGLETGDGPIRLTTSAADLPNGLLTATDYWIIRVSADDFQLAASLADAYAGTEVTFSDNGTGTHTLSDTASTERGIDGLFVYEATQAETNHDASITTVLVDGSGYARANGGGGIAVAAMITSADAWGEVELEDGNTRDDALRIGLRTNAAPFTYDTGTGVLQYRNLADTKDSHHGTITASGRSDAAIDDAT